MKYHTSRTDPLIDPFGLDNAFSDVGLTDGIPNAAANTGVGATEAAMFNKLANPNTPKDISNQKCPASAKSQVGLATLEQIWNEGNGRFDLSASGGDLLGGAFDMSYNTQTEVLGFSWGLGLGYDFWTSLTANLNGENNEGWGTLGASLTGGNGLVGGQVSAGLSQGGAYDSIGGGIGLGLGGNLSVITYSCDLWNLKTHEP